MSVSAHRLSSEDPSHNVNLSLKQLCLWPFVPFVLQCLSVLFESREPLPSDLAIAIDRFVVFSDRLTVLTSLCAVVTPPFVVVELAAIPLAFIVWQQSTNCLSVEFLLFLSGIICLSPVK